MDSVTLSNILLAVCSYFLIQLHVDFKALRTKMELLSETVAQHKVLIEKENGV